MKQRMHHYIFFPVFFTIIFWVIAAWLIFVVACNWYGTHTAQRRAHSMMDMILSHAGSESKRAAIIESAPRAQGRAYLRELMSEIRKELRNGNYNANLIVLDSDMEQSYVSENLLPAEAEEIQRQVKEQLLKNETPETKELFLSIGEGRWLVRLFSLGFPYTVRSQYFLVCVPILNLTYLLSSVRNLLLLIALLCIGLCGGMVWFLGKRLSAPIEQLCRQTRQIGQGEFTPLDKPYPVEELEELKNAFNQMSEKLKLAEEQNLHFFQNVSHDLRTPLVAISGYAQGIQCNVIKDPQKAAGIILSESMRLTYMVETLLTLSRVERREQPVHLISVNLYEFLEQKLELLKGAVEQKELILKEGDESLNAVFDPELFARVVQNAVSNCLRYARAQVQVSFQAGKDGIEIRIEDDGPGFSPEDLAHLNQRFYKGSKGHWGIGIPIICSLMEYMGGKAQIGNRLPPHEGAYYQLLIPYREQSISS